MSANGPDARYRPLRGTARALLLALRRGQDFRGPVDRLAAILGVSPRAVWLALALLADRRLIRASSAGVGSVQLTVTRVGQAIRL